MLKKTVLISIISLTLVLGGCGWWGGEEGVGEDVETVKEAAIEKAKELYTQKKAAGENFGDGPCLGVIMNDWVADIAHSPRLPIDNRPENQCPEYRAGEVHHFVELDPEGNLIRAK